MNLKFNIIFESVKQLFTISDINLMFNFFCFRKTLIFINFHTLIKVSQKESSFLKKIYNEGLQKTIRQ
jgi:hypothetical protein